MWFDDLDRVAFEFMELAPSRQEEVLIAILQTFKEARKGEIPPAIVEIFQAYPHTPSPAEQ